MVLNVDGMKSLEDSDKMQRLTTIVSIGGRILLKLTASLSWEQSTRIHQQKNRGSSDKSAERIRASYE